MPEHLIHIGYPKSGSTFLQKWFQQNPQLCYAPGGLGGFYNVYEISQQAAKQTGQDFMYYVTSDESLSTPKISSGKITVDNGRRDFSTHEPAKTAQKNVCRILKSLYPNAKILFVTRGFRGIIMSGYSQYIRSGGVLSFQDFADANRSAMKNEHEETGYGEEVNFSSIADMYEEAFGKENVITLPFELLRDDQNKFLTLLETRLELPHVATRIGKVNESLSPGELYWYPRVSSVVSGISHRFGGKYNARIYSWYVRKTLENKFRGFINMLGRFYAGRVVKDADFPSEVLDYFKDNYAERFAGRFRTNPMYTPYLSEYLLET